MPERVVVVGAGVMGLTCAVRLLEAGHRVDVLARDLPLETTSSVAAAVWSPPGLRSPEDRSTAWATAAYAEFASQADRGVDGVALRRGTELLAERQPDPPWAGVAAAFDRVGPPAPYADAWSFVAPVIDMPRYLVWLSGRVLDAGGSITRMALARLPEAPLVVNCSGLGSRALAGDTTTRPIRGQVVVVEQLGLDTWWLAEGTRGEHPTYVIPRTEDVVLGGTHEEGDWSRTPVPEVADDIVRRAGALVPDVAKARVLRHKVGLRPARPDVRLERVGDVIHCYGHSGVGVTLSWGCADEVARLADGPACRVTPGPGAPVSGHLASELASVSLRPFRPRSAGPERPHSTHIVFHVGMPSALSSFMPSIFEPCAMTTPP